MNIGDSGEWANEFFSQKEIESLEKAAQELFDQSEDGITINMSFSELQAKEIVLHYFRSRAGRNPVSTAYTEAFLGSVVALLKEYLDEKE